MPTDAIFNIGPRSVTVRAEISPLAGSDGQIAGAIILLHDLSHQKSAEHAVEGPPQLRLSPAGLAHEVKNPLAIMMMGVNYLNRKLTGQDENINVVLKEMRDAIDRADSITRGLLISPLPASWM